MTIPITIFILHITTYHYLLPITYNYCPCIAFLPLLKSPEISEEKGVLQRQLCLLKAMSLYNSIFSIPKSEGSPNPPKLATEIMHCYIFFDFYLTTLINN